LFFILDESKSDNEVSSNRTSESQMNERSSRSQNQKSVSFILKNQRQTVHKFKEVSKLQNENFSKDIKIHFVDGSSTTLKITVNTTAEEAVEKIAKLINLRNFLDFRLFLIDEYNNKKMIDEDELLFKFFCHGKDFQKIKWEFDSNKIINLRLTSEERIKRHKNHSIFHNMKKRISHYFSLSRIFSKENSLKLVFKKYFYLDQKLEKEGFISFSHFFFHQFSKKFFTNFLIIEFNILFKYPPFLVINKILHRFFGRSCASKTGSFPNFHRH